MVVLPVINLVQPRRTELVFVFVNSTSDDLKEIKDHEIIIDQDSQQDQAI